MPTEDASYCNYGTQNILSAIASATDNSTGLLDNITGMANSMISQMEESSLFINSNDKSLAQNASLSGGLGLVA